MTNRTTVGGAATGSMTTIQVKDAAHRAATCKEIDRPTARRRRRRRTDGGCPVAGSSDAKSGLRDLVSLMVSHSARRRPEPFPPARQGESPPAAMAAS